MLRVAFIGAGQMARLHLQAVQSLADGSAVVGIQDRVRDRANALADIARTRAYDSIDRLIEEARPDVVHVCTAPDAHPDAARAALTGGAHTYVEQPFARRLSDARSLIDLASAQRLIVCAGHELLRDPAFERLMARVDSLGEIVQVDSDFAFSPARLNVRGASTSVLARTLIEVLPYPLYALVSVLERLGNPECPIALEWVHAGSTDVQAVLSCGSLTGRLNVSLRARPVASSLTVRGTRSALTCDFLRSVVVGAGNPGSAPIEQLLNPIVEGVQLAARTTRSVIGRLRARSINPGLVESIGAFHQAVQEGGPSPVSPAHLLRVTEFFETLSARIDAAAHPCRTTRRSTSSQHAPLTVVTGARGFLGSEVVRRLPRVRGIGRSGWPDWQHIQEWMPADLGGAVRLETVANANVVVHLAAAGAGGFAEHQRSTIDATRHLLEAMQAAGTRRLVLVSSLLVLRAPVSSSDVLDEQTPRIDDPRPFGPEAWGKTLQEELVVREAAGFGVETRIIRPGVLIDWRDPALPPTLGRRVFGRWHVGFGRPGLPVAICDVGRCADVVAWTARHFDQAPPIVNLFDPAIATRGRLVQELRKHGWNGRMAWIPVRLASSASPQEYRVPQPRRIDGRLAARLLEISRDPDSEDLAAASAR